MTPDDGDFNTLQKELAYYKKRTDELAGENLKLDMAISGLKHELKQKRQGFALLSTLQQSIGTLKEISPIFELTIRAINATLGMDRTVVLTPTEKEDYYRPTQWTGFHQDVTKHFASLSCRFPPEFATGTGLLLVTKSSSADPLVDELRAAFDLPFFICVPVVVDRAIGLLLSGRLKEVKPLYPPLDHGDVDTFQAIAGLISASIRNLRVAVLEEMDRLKTAFFANISHEFRTPITLTLGPLEQILATRYGEVADPIRRQLEVMLRNQERLLGLINQILDLAKLEAGGMELKAAPMREMNRFVEERTAQFRALADKRGIGLRMALDPQVDVADLFVDPEKFDKVLFNLLSNAVKFTKSGSIEVATDVHQNSFRLTVADTGIGIKEDQIPYIFDRFRQADTGEAREYAGTGIGLALVKEITKLHGGDVTVHSQYGKGSVFRVSIPLGHRHLNPASVVEFTDQELRSLAGASRVIDVREGAGDQEGVNRLNREAETTLDVTKSTILYAEDNQDLREHVRDLLLQRYNVFLAVDGSDALEKTRKYRPDLIVADQMMPRMSGRDLLQAIRGDAELNSIPVIFLTARVGTQARIETLDAGADDYLAKPFDEGELLARIQRLLRARAQEREIVQLNRKLETQAVQLTDWNRTLEQRVSDQLEELERVSRLKRFLAPQLAELIVSTGEERVLESHRREVTVVFCDLRGFTAFAETAEPEVVMGILREFHTAMGELIFQFEGTLEHFAGDGLMVFFNDPLPCPDPAARAVRMAVAMRRRVSELTKGWQKKGYQLDFGVGIGLGYATLGKIGFEGRFDYGAIGNVTNLASRLCDEARPGQILISQRVHAAVEDLVDTEPVGDLSLKGFLKPVRAVNVTGLRAGGPE